MNDGQRAAADELIAGPRTRVNGLFIGLLRSPERMARFSAVVIVDQGTATLSSRFDPRGFERAGARGTCTRLEIQIFGAHAAGA